MSHDVSVLFFTQTLVWDTPEDRLRWLRSVRAGGPTSVSPLICRREHLPNYCFVALLSIIYSVDCSKDTTTTIVNLRIFAISQCMDKIGLEAKLKLLGKTFLILCVIKFDDASRVLLFLKRIGNIHYSLLE